MRGEQTPEGTRWTHRCRSCGRPFRSSRSHAKTCSATCRSRLRGGREAPEIPEGAGPMVLSLCDASGAWSEPYLRAGYRVRRIDLRDGGDVRLLEHPREPVRGILAAPPCTRFSAAAAGTWAAEDPEDLAAALAVVDACLRLVATTRPRWWAVENPVGRLERWLGPPALRFQPWHYGDPWTKATLLWGRFSAPPRGPVVRPQGSRLDTANRALRSQTPEGFARAFAAANP